MRRRRPISQRRRPEGRGASRPTWATAGQSSNGWRGQATRQDRRDRGALLILLTASPASLILAAAYWFSARTSRRCAWSASAPASSGTRRCTTRSPGCQPHADPGPRRADADSYVAATPTARRCSSTSTTSRTSTTRSATRRATGCCRRSRRGWTRDAARRDTSRAWVATSSSCSLEGVSTGPPAGARRRAPARRAAAAVRARRRRDAVAVTASIGIAIARRARRAERAAARRRHRDVPGEGGRQEPLRGVRARACRRRSAERMRAGDGPAPALADDEFFLVYQPIYRPRTSRVRSAWRRCCAGAPRRGRRASPTSSSRCSRRPA